MNYMGFDDFIYVIKVTEDGKVYEYEFGNPEHALDLLKTEPNGKPFKYNTKTGEEFEISEDELKALTA